MADITIDTALNANNWKTASRRLAGVSSQIVYKFFVDSLLDLCYRKSTDGQLNWGAKVVVRAGSVDCFDIWPEWKTPGDTGTKILIAYQDSGVDNILFRTLDPASGDALSTEVVVFDGATFLTITGGWDDRCLSLVKARGGNLYIRSNPDGGVESQFNRSLDGGASWHIRTNIAPSSLSAFLLLPGNTPDPQDVAIILYSATSINAAMYDDSADSWNAGAGTSLIDSGCVASVTHFQMSASIYHATGQGYLLAWSDHDTVTSDLRAYRLGFTDPTMVTRNILAQLITNTAEYAMCGICIDQNNGDLYGCYLGGGTWSSSANAYYKLSTNGGTSWGAQTQLNTTARNYQEISCDQGGTDVLFAPCYTDLALDDLFTNVDSGVIIQAPPPRGLLWHPTPMMLMR